MPESLPKWLPRLLQTNDSLFPSGTYSHSFGLEGMVELGLVTDAATLELFLEETILPLLRQVELPTLRLAYRAAEQGDIVRLTQLAERYGAMKSAHESRQASLAIGTQRLQLLVKLDSQPVLERLETERLSGEFQPHAVIVYAAQTAVGGAPLPVTLISYFYQTMAALVSAAMKLIRLGQIAAQQLLTRCLDQIPLVIVQAETVPEDELGCFQPVFDIASAQHETAQSRLFIS